MTDTEQRKAAKNFAEFWKGKGYEKGESQTFWTSLLRDVFDIAHPEEYIVFEEQVHLDNTSFIDARLPQTKVLIEQKSLAKDLRSPIRQSDGTLLNPFQQAKRYITELPLSQHPRWVVTCNFKSFLVYDMERPNGDPEEVLLENLPSEYNRLQFLVNTGSEHIEKEMELSIQAGEIVGKLYDAFSAQYIDVTSEHSLHSLNVLCVRLVFCLYAENSGLFGHYEIFYDYLASYRISEMRRALIDLFKILDTPEDKRDPYLKEENPMLAAFPYVNGGLFSDENIEIPVFTEEIRDLLLEQASAGFNWSGISPTIFGAVFESTLNPETRRSGGMHYTSIENIHKVIDPLFLNDLINEFDEICSNPVERTKNAKLKNFQTKLASLTFLDPACGSGNFLTETYLSLRRLENKVIYELKAGQISFEGGGSNLIQVNLGQFYGIEINDFAVTVAKTALWIAESQMIKETESIVLTQIDFLPLKSYTNIVEGNALRVNWKEVVPIDNLSFIMGNPPFVGGMIMNRTQKEEIKSVIGEKTAGVGEMDYVAGWFYRAADYIQGKNTSCAFVASNSIVQGQQATDVWEPLIHKKGVKINFAYRTFRWDSEAKIKAHVHCVIVGFSVKENSEKKLYNEGGTPRLVSHINSYLQPEDDWFVHSHGLPRCSVPAMRFGSMPRDGGNFVLSVEQKEELIREEPLSAQWIKKYVGSEEFLNNKERYCLWLVDANPEEIVKCPMVLNIIEAVRKFRMDSKAMATRKYAEVPTLFCQIAQPETDYILVPSVSSEKRKYVPMGFMDKNVIASNLVFLIPNATLYHFGVLMSNVHMAWMRTVCGRLEMRYRYSKDIVYNNFPWPSPTKEQRDKIEHTAQKILDARIHYPNTSLGDMYGEKIYLFPELVTAHQENDKAVMAAYGWGPREEVYRNENACVAELMRLYQKLCAYE